MLMFWKRKRIPFLIVGHPRCGTTSASGICLQLGLDVQDEKVGEDGISSWMMVADDRHNPFGNDELSRSRRYISWGQMILVVRDIKTAVPSVILENLHSTASFDFRRKHILRQQGIDLADYGDNLSRAVVSIVCWTRMVLAQEPKFWFRIEDQQLQLRQYLATQKTPPQPASQNFENVMTNAGKEYGGKLHEKPALSDQDWRNLPDKLKQDVIWYSKTFGYDLPPL
jgi:hypothetical protein